MGAAAQRVNSVGAVAPHTKQVIAGHIYEHRSGSGSVSHTSQPVQTVA